MPNERLLTQQELAVPLARRLRAKRLALKLSVDRLVDGTGVSRAQVVRLERAEGGATGIDTIYLLARGLGVSPAWLAFGLGPEEPEKPNRS